MKHTLDGCSIELKKPATRITLQEVIQ
jgi:hypothetical protein